MKKLLIIALSLFSTPLMFAQTVTIFESESEINKTQRPGLETVLALDKKQVKDDWKKYLKQYGKVEVSGNEYILKASKITSLSSSPVSIVSKVEKTKKGVTVFFAIDLGDKWITQSSVEYKNAEKILHDFGVTAYKNEINNQIKEAEKQLDKTLKAQNKTEKDGENLENKLKKNGEDKIKLENDLVKNKEDKIQLEKEIESNKEDQKKMKGEVGKSEKALEIVKEKLNKVH